MKSYRSLAYRELWAQKVTSILILIAVILSTTMTTAIGKSVGILAAMREQQAIAIGGNRYATIVQMNEEQVRTLRNDPRLSYTGVFATIGTVELNSIMTLGLNEYQGNSISAYPTINRIKEGRMPEKAMEIALPEDVLQFLGFEGDVGDTITISASKALRHGIINEAYDFTAEFMLTGIIENNYLGYANGMVQGVVGEGSAAEILPEDYLYYNVDIRTADRAGFQNVMDDLGKLLNIHELDIMYNGVYLNALGIRTGAEEDTEVSDGGFSLMAAAGILVGTLILLAAGLVIYNILKIAVSRRTRQYGALRAIGGERRQLYSIVASEVFLLCLLGIPAGLLLGSLSASGILTAATGLLSPETFMVQDNAELNRLIAENSSQKGAFLVLSAIVTLAFAFAAAFPAARAAAGVSPVVAMSGSAGKIKRRNRRTKKIRSFEAYYARLNLRRSPARTGITILSLVMSITVFITLQGFVALLNAAGTESGHMGDYSVVNEVIGFSPDELESLAENEDIEAVPAMQFSLYELNEQFYPEGISFDMKLKPGETFQIVGLNEAYFDGFFGDWLPEEQLSEIQEGTACVIRNPIPVSFGGEEMVWSEIEKGSVITVEGKELTVAETMDGYEGYLAVGNNGFTNGVQVIVSDCVYQELSGRSNYAELLPALKKGADREQADRLLESLCRKVPGSVCISYEDTDRQIEESFARIHLLAWGLILFVGLIGVLNIINTVYTNIHTRVKEIGIQRAIGMSVESLYKTFLWESFYYGLIASAIGAAAGYVCTIFVQGAKSGAVGLVAVPVVPMLEAAAVSVLACFIATCVPLRQISKMAETHIVSMSQAGFY